MLVNQRVTIAAGALLVLGVLCAPALALDFALADADGADVLLVSDMQQDRGERQIAGSSLRRRM